MELPNRIKHMHKRPNGSDLGEILLAPTSSTTHPSSIHLVHLIPYKLHMSVLVWRHLVPSKQGSEARVKEQYQHVFSAPLRSFGNPTRGTSARRRRHLSVPCRKRFETGRGLTNHWESRGCIHAGSMAESRAPPVSPPQFDASHQCKLY